jgi:hypothetical protein
LRGDHVNVMCVFIDRCLHPCYPLWLAASWLRLWVRRSGGGGGGEVAIVGETKHILARKNSGRGEKEKKGHIS